MKMVKFALVAVMAIGLFSLAVPADAFAAAMPVAKSASLSHDLYSLAAITLAVGLEPLRTQHAELKALAAAKIGEIKDGLSKDVVAKIEGEHKIMLTDLETVAGAIASAEKEEGKRKPWAAGFYATAQESGLTLMALNAIVAKADTHEQAKDGLIAAMAAVKNADKPGLSHTTVGTESREKFVTGATRSIIAKSALFAGDKDAERNEFSSLTLRELARMALDMNGVKMTAIHDPIAMVGRAMSPVIMSGQMATSDFVNILANVANKAMLKGFGEAEETFAKWTGKGTLSDFKTVSRVDLGLFPSLAKVEEGAEYSYAKLTDRAVTLALATYGKMFSITRQAIINDDLNAFTKIPAKMGRAANRTIGDLVYAILTANTATIEGAVLFHTNHKNLLSGGSSALSATSLDAARTAMAKQQDPDSKAAALNIRPRTLLVPVALEGTAKQLMASQTEPGQSNPGVGNRVAGMAEVVSEARLDVASATAWYLAANPALIDTIEVSYLNGVETPTLEQKEGWNTDGVEFKVRQDAGVNLLGFRGLLKSAGA